VLAGAVVADWHAELIVDSGAQVKTAARHPIRGAARVARFLAFVMTRLTNGGRLAPVSLTGGPAALVSSATGEITGAVFVEPGAGGNAAEIRWVRNPSKLTRLH
jgi:RNA polymerase sigma-70 factor (ECF subfamily)